MRNLSVLSRCVFIFAGCSIAAGQSYLINTIAGGGLPATPATATLISFESPGKVTADAAGNYYFSASHAIYKVSSSGVVIRVAGKGVTPGFSGDGGQATGAQLNYPTGIDVNMAGEIFIADSLNHRIRKISADGTIVTIAGTGTGGYSGDGGAAVSAGLNGPQAVLCSRTGEVYVADTQNHRIRRIGTDGIITTIAGTGVPGFSGDGGAAASAQLFSPYGISLSLSGDLYVADSNNFRVRKITQAGVISTTAGTGSFGDAGDGGPATAALLGFVEDVAVDYHGNVYAADTFSHRIRKIAPNGTISTAAGTGLPGAEGDNGPANLAQVNLPSGVGASPSGEIFIADYGNSRIRTIASDGIIVTGAGGSGLFFGDGGPATNAGFHVTFGVAADGAGNVYVADLNNNRVRKISASGVVSTVAGNGFAGDTGDGGPAVIAQVTPCGIALDSGGNLYIADCVHDRIRKVWLDGTITTVAGNGFHGYTGDNGPAVIAQLSSPAQIVLDAAGNMYIADSGNNRVRKVSSTGVITTLAGTGTIGLLGDGGPATSATLNDPISVAVDSTGSVLVADSGNYRVRKIATTGIITTVAGNGMYGASGNGVPALNSALVPTAIAADSSGNIYIADRDFNRVRLVTPGGTISAIAGGLAYGYSGDAGPAIGAQLFGPSAVAVNMNGDVLVADTYNNVVRLLTPQAVRPVLTLATSQDGPFNQGDRLATYTVTVSNAPTAGASSGIVTVTNTVSAGMTFQRMSGSGWACGGNVCTRSDALAGGASYPPITVRVNIDPDAPAQVTNLAALTGGGASAQSSSVASVIVRRGL